ncbi:MAG: ABC transporter substrate-binding protein [Actinobacteria bacterium]|nr:ABC transporter substrate-binding protein [Actinomycetota bacterium]
MPKHIVSLSPTGTEMLFAIGAGDQVTAVDSYSYYPAEAPVTELSAFQPDVEAVVSYGPDLVVVSHDPDGFVAGMEAVGVTVLMLPAAETLDDTYTQIEQLGAATGHVGEAALLVADMQTEIDEIVSGVPEFDEPPTYFHELSSSLYSASSGTFIGQVYGLLGLENIADAAEGGGLYPQLSAEYIIEQDPDFIFLADAACCGESAETVAARPGWGEMSAVTGGRVVELDTDVASRWGPRIVEFLKTVAGAVSKASVPTG